MLNVHRLDHVRPANLWGDEKELIQHEAESIREFYSLTGPARKEYTVQMAESEAERIRLVRQAQADGVVAIRKAEAEGFRLIGEALAKVRNPELVVRLATLAALQEVAQSLGDGKATKLMVPQDLGGVFSVLAGWKEVTGPAATDSD